MAINVKVQGGGWITHAGFGTIGQGKPLDMIPGELPKIARKDVFSEPDQRFGRLDDYSKLGVAAFTFAMRDANIKCEDNCGAMGVVNVTYTGSILADSAYFQTVVEQHGLLASPNLFAYTLSNCLLGEISIRFGITGPCLVIEQPQCSLVGIEAALDLLYDGICHTVVSGYCDVVGAGGQQGAFFLVLKKTNSSGELCYDRNEIYWKGLPQSDLVSLVNHIVLEKNEASK